VYISAPPYGVQCIYLAVDTIFQNLWFISGFPWKLLNQAFLLVKLKSSLRMFYGRLHDWITIAEYMYHKMKNCVVVIVMYIVPITYSLSGIHSIHMWAVLLIDYPGIEIWHYFSESDCLWKIYGRHHDLVLTVTEFVSQMTTYMFVCHSHNPNSSFMIHHRKCDVIKLLRWVTQLEPLKTQKQSTLPKPLN
jgi:hypothetical protein